jgi:hypothetical protein
MKGLAMAKKKAQAPAKKKAKAPAKKTDKPDLTSQQTISVLVPDGIAKLHPNVLKSLAHVVAHGGELGLRKSPHTAVQHVAIIKTSKVADQISPLPTIWYKTIPDGC